jgi:hypothetical protein
MKKITIFGYFMVLCIQIASAQTWTEMVGGFDIEVEYTVISKEQYDRIYNQNDLQNRYAIVGFHDVLEYPGGTNGRVIKGTKPKLQGYYYLIAKSMPRDPDMQYQFAMAGLGTTIIYGNSNTGSLTIIFGNRTTGYYLLGSNEFIKLYDQCIRFVNGE